jgi:hypothetical protein
MVSLVSWAKLLLLHATATWMTAPEMLALSLLYDAISKFLIKKYKILF